MIIIAALLITVTGCESTPEIRYIKQVDCSMFRIIYPTSKDVEVISEKLVEQILSHNEVLESCLAK